MYYSEVFGPIGRQIYPENKGPTPKKMANLGKYWALVTGTLTDGKCLCLNVGEYSGSRD